MIPNLGSGGHGHGHRSINLDLEPNNGLTRSIWLGIKAKVENRGQYDQYLEELKPLREELGVSLKEDLYPEEAK